MNTNYCYYITNGIPDPSVWHWPCVSKFIQHARYFSKEWISVHSVVLAIDLQQYTLATNVMY